MFKFFVVEYLFLIYNNYFIFLKYDYIYDNFVFYFYFYNSYKNGKY